MDYALPMAAPPEVSRFYWCGCLIEVECVASSRYAWLATETTVRVFGREVARSGGFRTTETASGVFVDPAGQRHTIEVRTLTPPLRYLARAVTCEILVDGFLVAAGPLAIRNMDEVLLVLTGTLAALLGLYWLM